MQDQQWHWGGGASIPDQAYIDKFFNRTRELIDNYDPDLVYYDDTKAYKSARTVVHTLIDVVSKNGNLLLSVPVRGNGTIDEQERAIVEEIGRWIAVNGEGIYDTRPWAIFGEGPVAAEAGAPVAGAGFNEGKGKPFSAADIRFTAKGETVYAFMMGWPGTGELTIRAFGSGGTSAIAVSRKCGAHAVGVSPGCRPGPLVESARPVCAPGYP